MPSAPAWFASATSDAQTQWLDAAAALAGLEVEAVELTYGDADDFAIRHGSPALVKVPQEGTSSLLLVTSTRRDVASVIAPDLTIRRVPLAAIRAALRAPVEAPIATEVDGLLREIQVRPGRYECVRVAMLRERLGPMAVATCWLMRLPPGSNLDAQSWHARIWPRFATLLGARACAYGLWILSWWVVGRAVVYGHLDSVWLFAWALLLATLIPCQLAATWLQGRIAVELES